MNLKNLMMVALVCVVAAFFALYDRTETRSDEVVAEQQSAQSVKTRASGGKGVQRRTSSRTMSIRTKPVLELVEDDDDSRTPEQKHLAEQIEKALDEEDFELAKACVKEAVQCTDVEIRQAMVDTLGWFGSKALSELLFFLEDADGDVAESARNEWEMSVSEIEDESLRIGAVAGAMSIMKDEDFLESISGEYIGIDEKVAVESLLAVIEGGGSQEGIAKAKETYEFVTGDEFIDRAAAERWLAEEYEPPEGP